jgi:hypothetical protein
MGPTIVIGFGDPRRGMDALAPARSLGDMTRARSLTVTSYMRDRYGMLPVQGWYRAMPPRRRTPLRSRPSS